MNVFMMKKIKQVFSMLLCVCMIAGILPVASPNYNAVAADGEICFDFQQEGVPYATTQFKAFDGGNWRYFNGEGDEPNAFATAYTQVQGLSDENKWIAFELDEIDPGIYDASFEIAKIRSGGTVDVYIIPYSMGETVLAGCTQDNLLGRIDFYADPLINPAFENLNQFTSFDGGKFLLVIRGTGIKNSGVSASYDQNPIWLRKLNLVKVGEAPEDTSDPKNAFLTIPNEIEVNETKKIAFTVEMESGRKKYALGENDTIEYIVEPAGVVDVAEDGKITGREVGEATIKAKLNFKGKELITPAVTIEVIPVKYMSFDFKLRDWVTELPDYNYNVAGNWQFYMYPKSIWPDCNTAVTKGHVTLISTGTLFILDSTEKWVALELDVPGSGVYDASIVYNKYDSGGILDLYLIPAPQVKSEEAISKALDSATKLGRVNYYGDPSKLDLKTDLNSVVIPKAGKYLFVTKGTGLSDSYADCAFTANLDLTLNDIEIEFKTDKEKLDFNTSTQSEYSIKLADGTEVDESEYTISYSSSNEEAVQIDSTGKITAVGIGYASVGLNISYKGKTYVATQRVEAVDTSDPIEVSVTGPESVYVGLASKDKIEYTVKLASGNTINKLDNGDSVSYAIQPEGAVTIDNEGKVVGAIDGLATVKAIFNIRGKRVESNAIEIKVIGNKKNTSRAIWTDEKREALRYNVQHDYKVKNTANSYALQADVYVEKLDTIYDMIVAEGLPRYYSVGKATDEKRYNCKYCGINIANVTGAYGWLMDPFNTPWKIQCPNCRRRFPSNDFGSYYKLGLDERGVFNPELAKERHIEKFGGLVGYGYLKNESIDDAETKFGDPNWGVDDGFGYIYTYKDSTGNTITEQHSYIAYYLHWIWYDTSVNETSILKILDTLKYAYLYTDQAKYGRAGAIILDRVADFYPDFDWYQWRDFRGDASGYRGTILDPIWSTDLTPGFTEAYDAFYPVYDDPQVINYLTERSKQWVMNPKDSAEAIRENAETRILKEVFEDAKIGNIAGNFGTTQYAVASAALAYNAIPESVEMLDWIMAPGSQKNTGAPANITGGNVLAQLVAVVDRDGMGNEASPSYNGGWIGSLGGLAELLSGYKLYPNVDLYKNPKFLKMFSAHLPLIMGGYYTAQIGDCGAYASTGFSASVFSCQRAYAATKDKTYAQAMYMLNGNSAEGLRYNDWVRNPSSLEDEVNQIIKTYGEMDLGSTMLAGYGHMALRDGKRYPERNTLRDFWIYNGSTTGHGHRDGLNLGFTAYGLNMAPDIGYPRATGTDPNRIQWVSATISHNTVTVDETTQSATPYRGNPMHFNDSGRVKLMDTERKEAYQQTDEFRRTVVMVEVDDSVSYGVDFFRVKGGDDHLYSFHSQSNEIAQVVGLDLEDQKGITYAGFKAGKDVPYGADPHPDSGDVWTADGLTYPAGYTWLDNVKSDATPEKQFTVDFKIKDWFRILKDSTDLHLRMTMVNDFDLEEVTIANGYPVNTIGNVNSNIKYVLARNKGKDLDTLFTTVFEPYKGQRYIKEMQSATVTCADGNSVSSDEKVKAVKVIHEDGRIDYIVYSTNNAIEYRIDDLFNFRGFIGVLTYSDENNDGIANSEELVYSYLNDGDVLADITDVNSSYTGEVVSFTEDLSLENEIVVTFDNKDIKLDELIGKYIYVQNDGVENGAYEIKDATQVAKDKVSLNVGDVTLVREYVNPSDPNSAFIYNISAGHKFRIPLTHVSDTAPTIEMNTNKLSASVGNKISFAVLASSDYGRNLTYEAISIPRGASFDQKTAMFTWTPENTQLGEHSVAIKVFDGVLSNTYNATITVYRSAGSTNDEKPSTPPASGNDSASGGGAGGGGGGGSSSGSGSSSDTSDDKTEDKTEDKPEDVVGGDTTEQTVKFVDLGNHAWAKDAIYALVDAGVVNGTSENTYSPANNIKRADFAIMLVRAFDVTGGEGEQFADVDANKYYAKELNLAKANGIVGGIGDNKFNPEGEISRQDMMLMLARALEAQGKKLDEADESVLAQFADAAEISDYAKAAVASVVKAGIITGSNGRINPLARATRAEIAVMLSRVLEK